MLPLPAGSIVSDRTTPARGAASPDRGAVPLHTAYEVGPAFQQRFELHAVLGRGGFGIVYRAYDRTLKRLVAVKVPHREVVQGTQGRRALEREAEATARLRHPHIVALHEFILTDQEAMLVSELIDGETLATWLESHRHGCSPLLAAGIVQCIARAVHHAHDQRVLHRDIKPSNILLDHRHQNGSMPFYPKLTDFGVARIVRDETLLETSTDIVGTYYYTPPEVIYGSADAHRAASDIYSLGVVFYELLVGEKPFVGDTVPDLLRRIHTGVYTEPRRVRSEIPRDLEAICLRCLAYRPSSRYGSAAELADDLDRFLRGEPVRARHPGLMERAVRGAQRHPTWAATLAAGAAVLLAFFLVLSIANRKLETLNAQLENSNTELANALEVSDRALYFNQQSTYANDVQKAVAAVASMHMRDVRTFLDRYADGQPLAPHRDLEWHYLRLKGQRPAEMLWQAPEALYCLASVGERFVVGGDGGQLQLIDPQQRRPVQQWDTGQGRVNAVAVDAEREQVWCSGDDGTAMAYDLQTGAEVHCCKLFDQHQARDLLVLPEQDRIVCLSEAGIIKAIDLSSGLKVEQWRSPETAGHSLVAIGGGRIAVSDSYGVVVLDGATGRRVGEVRIDLEHPVQSMAVDLKRERLLASCGKSIWNIDLSTLRAVGNLSLPDGPKSISYDAVRNRYIVSIRGGGMMVYGVDDQGRLQLDDVWLNDGAPILATGVRSDGGEIVTIDATGALRQWSKRAKTYRKLSPRDGVTVRGFGFYDQPEDADWPTIAVGSDEGLYLFHGDDAPRRRLGDYRWGLANLLPIDSQRLLIAPEGESAVIYQIDEDCGEELNQCASPLTGVAANRRWLVGTDRDASRVWLLDPSRPAPPTFLPAHHPSSSIVATRSQRVFWNDGFHLMSRGLHDQRTPSTHCTTFTEIPAQMALSADQRLLAVGLSDREVHLWDWQQNERYGSVLMHPCGIHALAFSAFGHTLLTVDAEATLRCWNLATGELTYSESFGGPRTLAIAKFSPDTRFLGLQFTDCSLRIARLY